MVQYDRHESERQQNHRITKDPTPDITQVTSPFPAQDRLDLVAV